MGANRPGEALAGGGERTALGATRGTQATTTAGGGDGGGEGGRWDLDLGDEPIIGGKYRLLRQLGQGGMGAVYEAQNQDTLKRCAVKLILSDHARNNEVRARFFREARASSVVDSAHIVQVFDSGVDETHDIPFMVMEMLSGENIDAIVQRVGAIDPQCAARITLQAAAGLAKAHQAGIVHRDIKPANIFLAESDLGDLVVKVLDFGIAKVKMEQDGANTGKLTRTGSTLGTPQYMSPEQAVGEKTIDGGSDVWSLGVVLFEMLTGTPPFDGDSLGALMVQVITGDIPHVQERAAWVPSPLAEIVHRCLSRSREHRYLDAGQLRDALQAWVSDSRLYPTMVAAPSSETKGRMTERLAIADSMLKVKQAAAFANTTSARAASAFDDVMPPARGRGALLAAIAVGVVAIGGVGGWYAMRSSGEPAKPAQQVATIDAAPAQPQVQVEPPPPPPPATITLALPVGPDGVTVEIDGVAATIENGTVQIEGVPGDTTKVTLRKGAASYTADVAITNEGSLVPSALELSERGTKLAKDELRAHAKKTQAKRPAGKQPDGKQPDGKKPDGKKPDSGISTNVDEFDSAPKK